MKSALKAKSFGQTLRKWRQEARLTQGGVATLIGVNASHIANIERNKRKPSMLVLSRIASLINVDARATYVLLWPEAKELIAQRKSPTRIDPLPNGQTNVQIHPGNTALDTTACILPGTSRNADRVNHSRDATRSSNNIITQTIAHDVTTGESTNINVIVQNAVQSAQPPALPSR
jgi:transcriptional regulator with XRE-family HTH domain